MGEKMQFTELDQYLFGQGTHYDIYKKLGAHPTTQHRKKGVYFAVWAPNARYVSVIGDFNKRSGRTAFPAACQRETAAQCKIWFN